MLAGVALVGACRGPAIPSAEELVRSLEQPEEELDHHGPRVELAESGPARWVHATYNAFRPDAAMEVVRFLDDRVRTAGSRGYDESLDELARHLREVGFGTTPGLELEELATPLARPAWDPLRAKLELETAGGGAAVLHAFDAPIDPDRCMLPDYAPSCDVRGPVALGLEELEPGCVLVVEATPRPDLLLRAQRAGAVALVSAAQASYAVDPTGRERHLDAIQSRALEGEVELPTAMISPRSYRRIVEAEARGGATLHLTAEVARGPSTARTLVATVVGGERPDETVVLPSHVLAPGANDNASGAAGLLEDALAVARMLERGGLHRPARSLTFVWGPELAASETWLAATTREPVAAVHPVMIGESRERTGAVPLLERTPDPGALVAIPPDQHSLWGARPVDEDALVPNGLAIVARCALVDVARHVGGWETHENPYEGGTDHEVMLAAGVPAVLFWHFTDFTFQTSLDRYAMVDAEELRRMAVAALCTALAVADPEPGDLDRYLKSMSRARRVRVDAARAVGNEEIAAAWTAWNEGVRHWFRALCLDLEPEAADAPGPR
ncbi:MAG: hypothetical protein H6828_01500 [Planctomycetes bacterium]|nr:hypothetical protein [Planctomycetota bacterium]